MVHREHVGEREDEMSRERGAWRTMLGLLVLLVLLSAACGNEGSPHGSVSSASTGPEVFTSSNFEFPLSLTLVDDWVVQADRQTDIDLQRGEQDASISSIASTTVAGNKSSDPPLPWPDDLYSWLVDRPEFEPTQPQDVTIGGHPGIAIDAVGTPKGGTSIQMVGVGNGLFWLVDQPQPWRFIEVKTGQGSGIVIVTNAPLDASDAFWKALDQLVATLKFR